MSLSNGHGDKQDVSQTSRKPEVILPPEFIFTPPFTTGGSKDFLGKSNYQDLKEKDSNSNRRISQSFHQLPTLLNDPLLNVLAYGSILGYLAQGFGLIPFDFVKIDLKEIRRKRSLSDWLVQT